MGLVKRIILVLICVQFLLPVSEAQYKKKRKVIPEKEYQAGWFHRFLFGDHWRDLWITPIEVNVIDLETFAGGLTPLKKGGGMQTKSLRFLGQDGREWKFRAIVKEPARMLPDELKESVVADVLYDQISSANPLAPLIVAPLLNAVEVLQAEPLLVILPDEEKLGEFRKEFGGLLGFIEVHPREGSPGFYDAEKVIGTYKLFEKFEDKRSERVNSLEFLKARLMDILLGDWDRHTDQWRWARYSNENIKYWHPIPRDRDQAFARFDGIFPRIAEYMVPQLNDFNDDYPPIEDLTWSGRFLDRRFLTELNKSAWDSIALYVQNQLSDSVICNAVKKLPSEYYDIAGNYLIEALIKRRNNLHSASDEFYYRINKYVDIYCSERDDFAEITRLNDTSTSVRVYRSRRDSIFENTFSKAFDNNVTKEIRIYLNGGDDQALVKGVAETAPLVRVIGGKGKDQLCDSSSVYGYFLSVTPFKIRELKTRFYDSDSDTRFITNEATIVDTDYFKEPDSNEEKYEPQQKDRGHEWVMIPIGTISSIEGLVAGGGIAFYGYGFRKTPYNFRMEINGKYASKPKSYEIDFTSVFPSVFENATFYLDASITQLGFMRFYGYGNETEYDHELEEEDFYTAEQDYFEIKPKLAFNLPGETKLELGISYSYSSLDLQSRDLLNNFARSYYGIGNIASLGFHSAIELDTRDNGSFPYTGFYFRTDASYYPKLFDLRSSYGKILFDFRSYFTSKELSETTLSLRMGGGRSFGDFPFYASVYLGGEDNLRGYKRERFAGRASLFGQVEVRTYVTDINIVMRGKFGINLFTDVGRVFIDDENSSIWHSSYGAGVWLSSFDRGFNLTGSIAISGETFNLYAGTSFNL